MKPTEPRNSVGSGLDLHSLEWRSTQYTGIEWCLLSSSEGTDPAAGEDVAVLVRMAPGRGYPAHMHRGGEHVLVLEGAYEDEFGSLSAGQYRHYPPGSVHSPVAMGDKGAPQGPENPACVLFAIARDGVELLDR